MKISLTYTFDSREEYEAFSAPAAPAAPAAPSAPRPAAPAPAAPSSPRPVAPTPAAPSAPQTIARIRRSDAQIRDAILGQLCEHVSGLDARNLARLIGSNPATVQVRLDAMSAASEIYTDGTLYWVQPEGIDSNPPADESAIDESDPDNYQGDLG